MRTQSAFRKTWSHLRGTKNSKFARLYNKIKWTCKEIYKENHFNLLALIHIHAYIIGHYNSSIRIMDQVSHTTHGICIKFIHKWWDSLKPTLNDKCFEKLFMAFLFNLRVFWCTLNYKISLSVHLFNTKMNWNKAPKVSDNQNVFLNSSAISSTWKCAINYVQYILSSLHNKKKDHITSLRTSRLGGIF